MKSLIYLAGFALMIWALIEQTRESPNIFVQIFAVVVFFFLMMRLMNKTPSNSNKDKQNNPKDESGN